MGDRTPEGLPTSTLLSQVLGKLRTEAEAEVGPGMPSLPVWANVLRCVDEHGLNERDLAEAARISKRLVAAAVTQVSKCGWITAEPDSGKQRMLRLTELGATAGREWPPALGALDRRWVKTPLRQALENLVSQLPFELPHFPASYGAADPSAIGGPFVQNAKRKNGLPAHGNDWRPVPRREGDTVSSLPITALLSQALMAFTIDYEDRFPWPLASTANVLVHIGTTPRPLPELPRDHGIAGNGKSLLERHLIVEVTKEGVVLGYRGERVLENHPDRLRATDATWRERHGDETVDALRTALTDAAAGTSGQAAHVVWSAAD